MDIKSTAHVYEAVPPYLNNRDLPEFEMVWLGLKAVSMPDSDKLDREMVNLYNDYARDKAAEMETGKRLEQIKSKVVSINNLVLDGNPVTSFDEFYANAPKELVQWVISAIHSSITLGLAERKNFLPESGSAAKSPAKRKVNGTASGATNESGS